jgi:hypothetical protein
MLPVLAAVVTVSCTYKMALKTFTLVFKEFVFSGVILINVICTIANKAMCENKAEGLTNVALSGRSPVKYSATYIFNAIQHHKYTEPSQSAYT